MTCCIVYFVCFSRELFPTFPKHKQSTTHYQFGCRKNYLTNVCSNTAILKKLTVPSGRPMGNL